MPGDAQATKESFRAELDHLVANFAANEAECTSPGYPEAQKRIARKQEELAARMVKLPAGPRGPARADLDAEIDKLVYDLYGLTDAERKLVEAATKA